jgi:hypothetical protein
VGHGSIVAVGRRLWQLTVVGWPCPVLANTAESLRAALEWTAGGGCPHIPNSGSLHAQGLRGVDLRDSEGGQETGAGRDCRQDDRNDDQGQGIVVADAVDLTAQDS